MPRTTLPAVVVALTTRYPGGCAASGLTSASRRYGAPRSAPMQVRSGPRALTRAGSAERAHVRRGLPRHGLGQRAGEPRHFRPRNAVPHDRRQFSIGGRVTERCAVEIWSGSASARGSMAPGALRFEDALSGGDVARRGRGERSLLRRRARRHAQERREAPAAERSNHAPIIGVPLGRFSSFSWRSTRRAGNPGQEARFEDPAATGRARCGR